MRKAENGLSGLVFPSDDSAEDEIFRVKQCLKDAGFSAARITKWLVDIFKHQDCFGDPTGESVFRHESDTFDVDLEGSLNRLKEWVEIGKDNQTTLALLFSLMLNFGPGFDKKLWPNVKRKELKDGSWDIPKWVDEFQKQANFSAESLDWRKLIEITKFDNLLPFLFPEGVPLNQIVNQDLLAPIQFQRAELRQVRFWQSERT